MAAFIRKGAVPVRGDDARAGGSRLKSEIQIFVGDGFMQEMTSQSAACGFCAKATPAKASSSVSPFSPNTHTFDKG